MPPLIVPPTGKSHEPSLGSVPSPGQPSTKDWKLTAMGGNCCYFPKAEGQIVLVPHPEVLAAHTCMLLRRMVLGSGELPHSEMSGSLPPQPQWQHIANDHCCGGETEKPSWPLGVTNCLRQFLFQSSRWDQANRFLLKPRFCWLLLPSPASLLIGFS